MKKGDTRASAAQRAAHEHTGALKVLDRKIDKVDAVELRKIVKMILYDLIKLPMRDMIFDPVDRQQAEEFLDNNVRWLSTTYNALERLFSLMPPEMEEREALRNIMVLIDLLIDLRQGSPSVFTEGLKRRRGDRRDNRRVREVKDQAARVYRFLVTHGANPAEATDTINQTIASHCKLRHLPKFLIFETEALRKRKRGAGALSAEMNRMALEMLEREIPHFPAPFPTDSKDERALLMRAVSGLLLGPYVYELNYVGGK